MSGKYNDGIPEGSRITTPGYEWLRQRFESEEGQKQLGTVRKLAGVAEELGCSTAQLALAWCLKNPDVSTVITGASKAEQVTQNMAALEVVDKLSDEVMNRIEEILDNKPAPMPDARDG